MPNPILDTVGTFFMVYDCVEDGDDLDVCQEPAECMQSR